MSIRPIKFHKVPELCPNRKVRVVRTEQLCIQVNKNSSELKMRNRDGRKSTGDNKWIALQVMQWHDW